MRLLQLCTNFRPGGIQRHVLDLTDFLRSKGHVVFLSGSSGPWIDGSDREYFLPLSLNRVSETGGGNLLSRMRHAFTAAKHLRRFITNHSVDLIHAHESAPLLVARLATLRKPIPVLVTYHGSSPARVKAFGRFARLAARLIITPSHRCASDLKTVGGVPAKKIRVIGLGVAPPPDISQKRIDRLREKLLGADGRLLAVTIARLTHQKGIDLLIEVVRKTKEVRPDIRFVLVGPGKLETEVNNWIKAAGIGSFLHYDGMTSEPYLYLQSADFFLLTSRWEALPITIVEAFKSGLPVVATDTGGVRELVTEAVGRVSAVGDIHGITENILEICSDEALRKSMSENALKLSSEDRFTPTRVHLILEYTYAEVLQMSARVEPV